MIAPPSHAELARYQAIYAQRRTRQYAGLAILFAIALFGFVASVTGFGHIRWFVTVGVLALFVHGFAVGIYWRCPRCHTSFSNGPPSTRCEACGIDLEPTPSREQSNDR